MRIGITIGSLLAILTPCPALGEGVSTQPTAVCELGSYACPSHPEFQATWPARCPICQAVLNKADAATLTLVADRAGRGNAATSQRQQEGTAADGRQRQGRQGAGDARRNWELRRGYRDYYGYTYPYGYRGYFDRYGYPYRGYSYGYPPRGYYYYYPDRGYGYRYPNYGYYPNYRYYDYGYARPYPHDPYWYYARPYQGFDYRPGTRYYYDPDVGRYSYRYRGYRGER